MKQAAVFIAVLFVSSMVSPIVDGNEKAPELSGSFSQSEVFGNQ